MKMKESLLYEFGKENGGRIFGEIEKATHGTQKQFKVSLISLVSWFIVVYGMILAENVDARNFVKYFAIVIGKNLEQCAESDSAAPRRLAQVEKYVTFWL